MYTTALKCVLTPLGVQVVHGARQCLQDGTVVRTHPLGVQVVHGARQCLQDGARFALREELLPHDLVKQLAAFHQLRHEVDLVSVVKHLQHASAHCSVWPAIQAGHTAYVVVPQYSARQADHTAYVVRAPRYSAIQVGHTAYVVVPQYSAIQAGHTAYVVRVPRYSVIQAGHTAYVVLTLPMLSLDIQ